MMRFKAAVLEKIGAPLVVREVTAEALKPYDVLVRNQASGLCHTDLEIIQGQLAWPIPVILGHEGAGIVEAVGRDVSLVKPGDHVVCSWSPTCGHCFYCDRGQPILCEPHNRHNGQGALLDGGSRLSIDGQRLHHFSAVSSHAECSIVHETSAIPVPKEIPFDRACLIGCGVMTGVGGASRMARVQAGASVAVIVGQLNKLFSLISWQQFFSINVGSHPNHSPPRRSSGHRVTSRTRQRLGCHREPAN